MTTEFIKQAVILAVTPTTTPANSGALGYIVTAVVGLLTFLAGIVTERYKSRLTILTYTMNFNAVGTSTQNSYWGDIQILHNGRQTRHLNYITIEISNNSNNDLGNLNLDLWVDPSSQILGFSAHNNETRTAILLETEYTEKYHDALRRSGEDAALKALDPNHVTPDSLLDQISWIQSNKSFSIPALNRRTGLTINLLVENFAGQLPAVMLGLDHKGVKLLPKDDSKIKHRKYYSLAAGFLCYVWLIILIIRYFSAGVMPLLLTAASGVISYYVGWMVVRIFYRISRWL